MDRWVVITGASKGIGKAIAEHLAEDGYSLLLVSRSADRLEVIADELKCDVKVLACDVTSADAGSLILNACPEPYALVNNAGIAQSAPLKYTSDELIARHMVLNFNAPMRLMRDLIHAITRQSGRIVNICSTAAITGYPYVSAYVASKHALLGATRALAKEFAAKGVTINAVCPGYVRTEMFAETLKNIADKTGTDTASAEQKLSEISPQNRVFETDEVAGAVAYLLSHAARGVNGQAITIDGGEIEL
ncbi:MAG: SDR family NAD(P)-dependent oxidoreductase [Planctomycetota bacterium]|jgi:NAD(P)-dependent dehydrogenase (short-subunit alcohol dehydrogenase family)